MSTRNAAKRTFRFASWLTALTVAAILPGVAGARPQDRKADADEVYRRAQKQFEKREFDEAIKLFNQVVRLDPTYVEAYVSRGMAWNEKGDYDKAIKDFTAGIQVDAKFVPAYINRGISWMEKSEFDKALKDLDAAVKLDPKDDAARFHRGVARLKKRDYDAAIEDFEASIGIDGKYAPAYYYRGQAQYSKKEYEKALKDYDESLRLDSRDAAVLNAKAWLLATCPVARLRQGKTALELATKACELTDWKDVDHLDTLSCACAEAGRFDEAVKWQKKVLAGPETSKEAVDAARARLKLFEQKKPYRDE